MSDKREERFFEFLNDEDWADLRTTRDGSHIDVEFRVRFRKDDWDDFDNYTTSRGHGSGLHALHGLISPYVLQYSTDYRLDSGEVKSAFSPWQLMWYETVARYLLTAHMTVILAGYFIEQVIQTGSKSYVLSLYLYSISLGINLLAYALLIVRKSFLRDGKSLVVQAERRIIVWASRYSGILLVVSALTFTIFSLIRFTLLLRP